MVKPDGVHRGLVGEIIKRFEQRGYKLVAIKFVHVSAIMLVFLGCMLMGNEWESVAAAAAGATPTRALYVTPGRPRGG